MSMDTPGGLSSALVEIWDPLLVHWLYVEERLVSALDALLLGTGAEHGHAVGGDGLRTLSSVVEDACANLLAHTPPPEVERFVRTVLRLNWDLRRLGEAAMQLALTTLDHSQVISRVPSEVAEIDRRLERAMIGARQVVLFGNPSVAGAVARQVGDFQSLHARMLLCSVDRMVDDPRTIGSGVQLVEVGFKLEAITTLVRRITERACELAGYAAG